jgi:hypothetical protein
LTLIFAICLISLSVILGMKVTGALGKRGGIFNLWQRDFAGRHRILFRRVDIGALTGVVFAWMKP